MGAKNAHIYKALFCLRGKTTQRYLKHVRKFNTARNHIILRTVHNYALGHHQSVEFYCSHGTLISRGDSQIMKGARNNL